MKLFLVSNVTPKRVGGVIQYKLWIHNGKSPRLKIVLLYEKTLKFLKKTLNYLKKTLNYLKKTLNFLKKTLNYLKKTLRLRVSEHCEIPVSQTFQ